MGAWAVEVRVEVWEEAAVMVVVRAVERAAGLVAGEKAAAWVEAMVEVVRAAKAQEVVVRVAEERVAVEVEG